jgi:cytosine/adenosine deaminase-related metal-dependent hydrolase
MNVRDVLVMATVGGARANGLIDRIGTLSPGKEADIVMIRTDNINIGPLNNAVGTLVIGAGIDGVDAVMIGGRLKKWKGQLLAVDPIAVVSAARASRDYLAAETGLWKFSDIIA